MESTDGSGEPWLPAPTARRLGLDARSQLDDAERARASSRLTERLLALPELEGASKVAGYWPIGPEVDLREALRQLHLKGTAVHLPVVDPTGAPEMAFVRWSPDAKMQPNRFSIPEPAGTGEAVERLAAEQLAVVVVPCVAVDRHGTRVGMGAGYYDRALRLHNPDAKADPPAVPVLVGVAYECQLLQRIDAREWDVAMDIVLTESRVVRSAGPA